MIVDNFIKKQECDKIKNEMLHGDFNWYYCKNSIEGDEKIQPMFQHNFLRDGVKSYKFSLLDSLIEKIKKVKKPSKFLRIKSNMYLKQSKNQSHTPHTDCPDLNEYGTAIYYLTTTNGSTTIGNKVVKDKENRIVFFDGNTKHNANTQTNKPERIVININYIK